MINYLQLPDWLQNSRVFRSLFLIRKVFLIRSSRSHFSQFAEDVTVSMFFPKEHRGFFVDVGCFHPSKYNNTWRLYKRGWRGVNVDIDEIKIRGFKIRRPEDTNVQCAVSSKPGPMKYYSNGYYTLTTSCDDAFVDGKPGYVEKQTHAERLTSILDRSPYRDRPIDFLSVDVEGHDMEVLQSLDFERYAPRLIAVESHERTLEAVVQTPVYKLLSDKGYTMVGWCGLTLIMAQRSFFAPQQSRAA